MAFTASGGAGDNFVSRRASSALSIGNASFGVRRAACSGFTKAVRITRCKDSGKLLASPAGLVGLGVIARLDPVIVCPAVVPEPSVSGFGVASGDLIAADVCL